MCQWPQRSRKLDMFALLVVEIPALICALLRLFSRWYTCANFTVDDYVMLVVTGILVPFLVIGQMGMNPSAFPKLCATTDTFKRVR